MTKVATKKPSVMYNSRPIVEGDWYSWRLVELFIIPKINPFLS
jgi:hypothetical protein